MSKEQEELKEYHVEITDTVLEKIAEIERYIAEKYSQESARKKVSEIFEGISGLEIFPHGGFDVDERFGIRLDEKWESRAVPLKKDYIALYFIDEEKDTVVVTDLFSTKSNYIRAFK